MTHLLPDSFQPRLGIASIELTDHASNSLLPEDARLQPIDAAVERQLEILLQAETFEKVMLDAMRPRVNDQSILQPGLYHWLREEVLVKLDYQLHDTSDRALAKELQSGIDLLKHLGDAHDLGEQYRYALLKG